MTCVIDELKLSSAKSLKLLMFLQRLINTKSQLLDFTHFLKEEILISLTALSHNIQQLFWLFLVTVQHAVFIRTISFGGNDVQY